MPCGIASLVLLYTDPGTGTLILQLLIAAFFGVLFYIRFFVKRVGGFFSRKKGGEAAPDEVPSQAERLPDTSSTLSESSSRVNSKV
ncbi:MAG TPA: hypothetical protein VG148_06250 [Pyrinomonadaceae bacterium]|nr:hypothetical protein [Pyrinomonadaceae bacterium]